MIREIVCFVQKFIKKLNDDSVNALSAQSAFFLILSFFPFIMLILPLIKYIPIRHDIFILISESIFPDKIEEILNTFAEEIYAKPSIKLISVTALTTLWTASGGILSLMRGLNQINGIEETRGYIRLRILSTFYTVIFIAVLICMTGIFLFGNIIYNYIISIFPNIQNIAEKIIGARTFGGILLLSVLFWLFYYFLPNRKCSPISEIAGSIFSAVAWVIFSYIYSFYINHISNYSYIYGSLAAVVFLMLWLYVCMYILFIGEEINIFIRKYALKIRDIYDRIIYRKGG